jgi:hypothetical protein
MNCELVEFYKTSWVEKKVKALSGEQLATSVLSFCCLLSRRLLCLPFEISKVGDWIVATM